MIDNDARELFLAIGLVIGTIFLLAASLAVYDLIVQIATIGNLFGTASNSTSSTPLDTSTTGGPGLSCRQIFGQFLFSLILVLIAVAVLWYFKPFGGANQKDLGASRGVRDAALIRGSPIPGLLVLR